MENNIKKEYKLVFNAGIARNLIRLGFVVADIKSDRNNPDKTVFVFKRTPEFEETFAKINQEISDAKANVEAQG